MIERLFLIAALGTSSLFGQATLTDIAYQVPGWIGTSDSTPIAVHVNRPDGQTGPVLNKPFSATEVRTTTQTLADGTHLNHSDRSTFYRDAEGRMRDESTDHILIYDPVAGVTYNLYPKTKTEQEYPIRSGIRSTTISATEDGTWINDKSSGGPSLPLGTTNASNGKLPAHTERVSQVHTEDLGQLSINGIRCTGSRITMTIPAGAISNDQDIKVVNERWYSDDLMVLVKTTNSDPRFGVSTYELTNIVKAAPNPSSFQVPADYTPKSIGQR